MMPICETVDLIKVAKLRRALTDEQAQTVVESAKKISQAAFDAALDSAVQMYCEGL